MLPEAEIEHITEVLKKDERIVAAYLLGSALGGHMRSDSDLDIALLPYPGHSISRLDRLFLNGLLGEHSRLEVDVGLLGTDNLVYVREAVFRGKCLFCKDRAWHDLFVATALGLYAELQISRKEVIDAYTA